MIARHEAALKRTARRYSLDAEDVDDAYQRALEIVLTKAPTTDPRELIRWTQTVTKHEALAVRHGAREAARPTAAATTRPPTLSPVLRRPATTPTSRRSAARRSPAAARRCEALKPAELRALSLLAAGHSYAEIGELTGFSQTKINRVLAEGRDRFRGLLSSSEDGSRCRELRPLLSAFCDGEASPRDVGDRARAPAGLRALPRDDARLPGGSADRGGAGAGAARPRARCWNERTMSSPGSPRGCPASAAAATRPRPRLPWPAASRGAGMVALAKLWRSAPGRREPPPAWRPACCRRLTWRPGTRSPGDREVRSGTGPGAGRRSGGVRTRAGPGAKAEAEAESASEGRSRSREPEATGAIEYEPAVVAPNRSRRS